MEQNNPLDIFNAIIEGESLLNTDWKQSGKERAEEADRKTPAINEIKTILNRIIDTQTHPSESWDILVSVLRAFPEDVRKYIYMQAMKK